jgi:threonine dehydrogenase-like Zn-dependent dehydrogenase
MRALCWHGKGDVRVDTVPDPKIQHPRDAVIKITACAICGSDLHLFDGYQPTQSSRASGCGSRSKPFICKSDVSVTAATIGDNS